VSYIIVLKDNLNKGLGAYLLCSQHVSLRNLKPVGGRFWPGKYAHSWLESGDYGDHLMWNDMQRFSVHLKVDRIHYIKITS